MQNIIHVENIKPNTSIMKININDKNCPVEIKHLFQYQKKTNQLHAINKRPYRIKCG